MILKKYKILISFIALSSVICLSSCSSNTPYIGENGNWWLGSSDLGVLAKGETGAKGDSVFVVSIGKIKTEGKNDIYEIKFSDGTKTTFTVTNGMDGSSVSVIDVSLKLSENGVDTYEILFSNGYTTTFTITNGKDLTVLSIEKVSTQGLFDTYRINYSDGKYIEFVVGNGATPYIGDNGNWWIDGIDTGVVADYSKEDQRVWNKNNKLCSAGLIYTTMTIMGKSGYVVSEYDDSLALKIALDNFLEFSDGLSKEEYSKYIANLFENQEIVIPNYIGSIPVIGIGENAFLGVTMKSISISKNTIYLGNGAFSNTRNLTNFDFNDSKITYISESCFSNSNIKNIVLPPTVKTLYDKAFYKCELLNLDLSNLTYFGYQSLEGLMDDHVWLSKNVRYVSYDAFSEMNIYIEQGAEYSLWGREGLINSITTNRFYGSVIVGCYKSSDLIYSYNEEGGVTAYKWLKEGRTIEMPSIVDGKEVTRIGVGFANDKKYIDRKIDDVNASNSFKRIEQIKISNTVK